MTEANYKSPSSENYAKDKILKSNSCESRKNYFPYGSNKKSHS